MTLFFMASFRRDRTFTGRDNVCTIFLSLSWHLMHTHTHTRTERAVVLTRWVLFSQAASIMWNIQLKNVAVKVLITVRFESIINVSMSDTCPTCYSKSLTWQWHHSDPLMLLKNTFFFTFQPYFLKSNTAQCDKTMPVSQAVGIS